MLVHIKEIVEEAKKKGFALGAFNVFNLESILSVAEAAAEKKAAIIIQVSETTIDYAGLKAITHIVKTVAKNQAKEAKIAFHLDHGKNFLSVMECIEAGFSSIMMDASNLIFDENVALTKKAVDYAHRHKVWAQGEVGRIVKEAAEIKKMEENPEHFLTKPEEACEFVKKTGVDSLAISIGNVHGTYKMKNGVPHLFLDQLRKIKKMIDIPLVLHGASGIKEEEIKKAIELGIVIINIDTEIRLVFRESLIKSLAEAQKTNEFDPRKILKPSIETMRDLVIKKIEIFGQCY